MVDLFRKPAGNPYQPVPGPAGDPGAGAAGPGPVPAPGGVPPGLQQFGQMVDGMMPTIESITGLNRREISMQLLKTGLKGGGWDNFVSGLFGQIKPPVEPKFVTFIKTIAIYGPIALILLGLGIATLFIYAKFLMHLVTAL